MSERSDPQPGTTTTIPGIPDLGYILEKFAAETDCVMFAQTMSADGMNLAATAFSDHEACDTLAAIVSGLASLTDSSAEIFGLGEVTRQIVEASDCWVLVSRLSHTATVAVVASRDADLGLVGYEMTHLAKQLGPMLSPDVVNKLKQTHLV